MQGAQVQPQRGRQDRSTVAKRRAVQMDDGHDIDGGGEEKGSRRRWKTQVEVVSSLCRITGSEP